MPKPEPTFEERIAAIDFLSERETLDANFPTKRGVSKKARKAAEEAITDLRDAYEVRERAKAELHRPIPRGVTSQEAEARRLLLRRILGRDGEEG